MNKWDNYFLGVCKVIGSNSPCHSRQIGAILVRDKSIIATGYNGPPRDIPHCGEGRTKLDPALNVALRNIDSIKLAADKCPRKLLGIKSGEGMEWCTAAHAERNCIVTAARNGTSINKSILYLNDVIPCKDCLIEIINGGIEQIVVTDRRFYDIHSEWIIDSSNLIIREFGENV